MDLKPVSTSSNREGKWPVQSIRRRILSMAALGLALGGSPVFIVAGDDLPGKVVHSWLANSFARQQGHQSVPVNVCGIGVTPDGTVFSAGVAEGEGGVASYKGGEFVTKYDYDSGFGSSASAVAADDAYVYIGTGAGLFRTRRGDESYNRTPIAKGNILGLALREGELYLSDYDAGKVRVLATSTMKEVRSFPAPSPGPIAVGRRRQGLGHSGQARQGALSLVLHGRPQGRLFLQGRPVRTGDRGLRESLRTGSGPEGTAAGRRAEPPQPGLDLRCLGTTEKGGHLRRGGRHLLRQAGTIWSEEVSLDPRPGIRRGR